MPLSHTLRTFERQYQLDLTFFYSSSVRLLYSPHSHSRQSKEEKRVLINAKSPAPITLGSSFCPLHLHPTLFRYPIQLLPATYSYTTYAPDSTHHYAKPAHHFKVDATERGRWGVGNDANLGLEKSRILEDDQTVLTYLAIVDVVIDGKLLGVLKYVKNCMPRTVIFRIFRAVFRSNQAEEASNCLWSREGSIYLEKCYRRLSFSHSLSSSERAIQFTK